MATNTKTSVRKKPAPAKGSDFMRILGIIALIGVGVGIFAWLYVVSGNEKPLNCTGGQSSLIGFGSCTTD